MTDATTTVAPPKKRSLFKRPAFQDTPKDDEADIFSHSNEFSDIVADEARRRAQAKQQEDKKKKEREQARQARKHTAPRESKRRRTSDHAEEPVVSTAGSDDKESAKVAPAGRASSRAYVYSLGLPTPILTAPSRHSTTPFSSTDSLPHKDSLVIDLDDAEKDDSHQAGHIQDMAVRSSRQSPVIIQDDDDDDDEAEDDDDSMFAALKARVRARIAAKAKAAASSSQGGETHKAPIIQLLITSCIPNTSALMVKIRVDSYIEKPRKAWCTKQGFSPKEADNIFFTWKGTRIYDSTSITRLGITVDDNGNVSMEGDTNIYDDVNLPKVHVEAWTDELYKAHKKEEAAAAAAKKLAAEAPVVLKERTPTPEPSPTPTKLRLILRAKGKADFGLTVNPVRSLFNLCETNPNPSSSVAHRIRGHANKTNSILL